MAQRPDYMDGNRSMAGRAGTLAARLLAFRAMDAVALEGAVHTPASAKLAPREVVRSKMGGLGFGERKLLQAFSDWLVIVSGVLLVLAQSENSYRSTGIVVSLGVFSMLWFFFSGALDAYRLPVLQSKSRSAYTAVEVLVLSVVAYILIAWLAGGTLPVLRPRISEAFEMLLFSLPLIGLRMLSSTLLGSASLRRRVAVVGANRTGYEIMDAMSHFHGKIYEFVGYFDDVPEETRGDSALGGYEVLPTSRLSAIHQLSGIDQIVLANPTQTVNLLSTLSSLHEQGVQITPMFAIYQDLTGRVPVAHLGSDCYVALPAYVKSTARPYLLLKRITDVVLALTILFVAMPAVLLAALAIKLDSPGPVFFRQVRVGRGGKLFRIVKFRSMRPDAEAATGAVWATQNDNRITRVGRFLRKSRLDEVPQLWNVFVGDMSLVGPRPERPEFDEELEREIPFYRARRAVRPGLTGWAQVSHGYGNTLLDALRKVEYDLYYIKNESLYLDLMILLRTVAVVFKLGGT